MIANPNIDQITLILPNVERIILIIHSVDHINIGLVNKVGMIFRSARLVDSPCLKFKAALIKQYEDQLNPVQSAQPVLSGKGPAQEEPNKTSADEPFISKFKGALGWK